MFRFDAGAGSDSIYQTFLREMALAEDTRVYNTEQAFLTHAMKDVVWWPEEWVRSFKWHCRPVCPLNLVRVPAKPEGCRILVFHGRPDPDEAVAGFRGKSLRHHTLAAPWIADYWQ